MTSRLNVRSLLTAVALDGIGSNLQPLFRLYSVIYELDENNLTLSVLAAGLFSSTGLFCSVNVYSVSQFMSISNSKYKYTGCI